MYSDMYNTTTVSTGVDSTWLIISIVLALVGGIALYILFVSKDNNGEYTGFLAWAHDFLNFKTLCLEAILKVCYLITFIFITLGSFSLITTSVASFFAMLIFGNVIARISYELLLMLITIASNTSAISKKLDNLGLTEEKKPAKKSAKSTKTETVEAEKVSKED